MTFNVPDIEVDEADAASALGQLMDILSGGGEAESSDPFAPNVSAPSSGAPAESEATGTQTSSPVAGNAPISGKFGEQRGDHVHAGVDLSVPVGSQILAANSGTVTVASESGGYGNLIEIRGDDGIVTRYGHMSGMNVAVGAKVRAGQPIGKSGGAAGAPGAGNSTGAHLHFEVRQGDKGIDPTPFLAGGYQIIGAQGADGNTTTADPKAIAAAQIQNVINVLTGDPMINTEQTSTTSTQPGATAEAGSDPDQWIRQAMAATGVDESWFAPLKARMMQESGGRNIPQGITDINTQKGTPAFGPMQVIEPTFRANALKGYDDWHNPVHNTIAAIRYIASRYGHPSRLPKGGY